MRYSRYHWTGAYRLATLLVLAAVCTFCVSAKDGATFQNLTIRRDDGSVSIVRGYPGRTIRLLFPSGEALVTANPIPNEWKISSAPILKKIQTFRVSDINQTFQVVGATFGDQLFIFDGVFGDDNATAMSQLIRVTSTVPHDAQSALDLTKLYLALAYYRLDDPDRYVAYRGKDIAGGHEPQKETKFSDMLGIANSPKVTRDAGSFVVDLFAFDAGQTVPNKVNHWQIGV